MPKFAHMADCHIGAWRDRKLREINLKAFEKAVDICMKEEVDFILISGDLFDTNIPDLSMVRRAVEKLKTAKDCGINTYMVYGSHDYSPNTISMVDVLESADLFGKVSEGEFKEDSLKLQFFQDPKTGAKMTGLPGRKIGLEKEYFEALDVEQLEKEPGFKIFLFHTCITELNPGYTPERKSVPVSMLPRNFNYYAGGNIHQKTVGEFDEYPNITYPGPLFGTNFNDLEDMAKGAQRGFFIVEFGANIENVQFHEVDSYEVVYNLFNAEYKTAGQIEESLTEKAETLDVEDKIILFRVAGILSAGRPIDINFRKITEILLERGAVYSNINRYALKSKEQIKIKVKGEQKTEIEGRILRERISSFDVDPSIQDQKVKKLLQQRLVGENGIALARNLLYALKEEKREGETKTDFHKRVLDSVLEVTQLEGLQ